MVLQTAMHRTNRVEIPNPVVVGISDHPPRTIRMAELGVSRPTNMTDMVLAHRILLWIPACAGMT